MAIHEIDTERILRDTFVASVEHHLEVGSTNDLAKGYAKEGVTGELPLLIVADSQTAGRGRGKRRWWTGKGSLAFSLLLDPKMVGGVPGGSLLVGLATAVALVEAVRSIEPNLELTRISHQPGTSRNSVPLLRPKQCGENFRENTASGEAVAHSGEKRGLGLHWPNDVFVADRKLAGILVEVLADRRQVIGVGLNTNNKMDEAPPELAEIATTMTELTGRSYCRTEVLIAVLNALENMLTIVVDNPDKIGHRANSLCLQHGETLTIRCGKKATTGRSAGIASDGALLLDTESGRRAFYSGQLE